MDLRLHKPFLYFILFFLVSCESKDYIKIDFINNSQFSAEGFVFNSNKDDGLGAGPIHPKFGFIVEPNSSENIYLISKEKFINIDSLVFFRMEKPILI
jgi:hypothetical protein